MISAEQQLPTRWVLRGVPDRETFAKHVWELKRKHSNKIAKGAIRGAIWVGCLPTNRGRKNRNW